MDYEFRPLIWTGVVTPESERRSRWTFKADWSNTLALLERELRMLNVHSGVLIQADFRPQDITLKGTPRANARQPAFPGVIISFFAPNIGEQSIGTDTCSFWQHNVRSIALGMEALRAVSRHGIGQRYQQYQGYRELGGGTPMPAAEPKMTLDEAYDFMRSEPVIGLVGGGGITDPKKLYRLAVKKHHPDVNPDSKLWPKIDEAWQLITKAVR